MSEAPERIWAWWDDAYDVGLLNEHGDKRYTPNDAKEYVRADRIEELEAKLDWVIVERDETFALMLDRAQTAEAKLAKAVEALPRWIVAMGDWEQGGEQAIEEMTTTLAELKGGKDD